MNLTTKIKTIGAVLSALFIISLAVQADDKDAKPKPYPLKTCVVSGEKLGGDGMEPYVWTYKGQEIKMCCKDCKADFMKDPDKFMKKIADAEKAEKK